MFQPYVQPYATRERQCEVLAKGPDLFGTLTVYWAWVLLQRLESVNTRVMSCIQHVHYKTVLPYTRGFQVFLWSRINSVSGQRDGQERGVPEPSNFRNYLKRSTWRGMCLCNCKSYLSHHRPRTIEGSNPHGGTTHCQSSTPSGRSVNPASYPFLSVLPQREIRQCGVADIMSSHSRLLQLTAVCCTKIWLGQNLSIQFLRRPPLLFVWTWQGGNLGRIFLFLCGLSLYIFFSSAGEEQVVMFLCRCALFWSGGRARLVRGAPS